MSHIDLALIDEFANESLELLTQLGDACGQLNTGHADETQLATIDRGLHTLKGNAAALGLKDLSHAAGTLLDRWRSEGTATLSLIWRFLADCRRYVVLVGGQGKPRDGFFEHIVNPQPAPRAIVKRAPQETPNVAAPAAEPSVDEILASVPPLHPDISALAAKAAEHLKRSADSMERQTPDAPFAVEVARQSIATQAETPMALELALEPDEPPAARSVRSTRSIGRDLGALRSHEVSRQLQSLSRRLAQSHVDAPELESALLFLEQLREAQSPRQRVPLESHLQQAVDEIRRMGAEVGRKLEGRVIGHETPVLEALAELVRHQITEILRGRLCMGRIASLDSTVEYSIEANASGDELLVLMKGLGQRPRMSALDRLRQQTSMDFVQDLRARLRHGDHPGELELSMDIGAVFTSEVCLLETVDARFYLPATCIASVGDLHPGATEIVVRSSSGPRRMKLCAMEERETLLVAAADEELAAEGLLGHCLCLRRAERVPLLDPDSL